MHIEDPGWKSALLLLRSARAAGLLIERVLLADHLGPALLLHAPVHFLHVDGAERRSDFPRALGGVRRVCGERCALCLEPQPFRLELFSRFVVFAKLYVSR